MGNIDYNVRSIQRGMAVLQSVNRHGVARYVDIANSTGIPYPTVCRIVNTLIEIGLVEREANGFAFRPTALVQSLSVGFEEDDNLIAVAHEVISELCRDVGWPITMTTRVGASMIIRDSTHRQTTMTYNHYSPGYALPLLECSVGKAYLAFCDEEERISIISTIKKLGDDNPAAQILLHKGEAFVKPFQERGYAYHNYNEHTKDPGKTSSLAVPVFINATLRASMGLIYFSSAMDTVAAAEKYVSKMHDAALKIETSYLEND